MYPSTTHSSLTLTLTIGRGVSVHRPPRVRPAWQRTRQGVGLVSAQRLRQDLPPEVAEEDGVGHVVLRVELEARPLEVPHPAEPPVLQPLNELPRVSPPASRPRRQRVARG